jgi:hypothetical protein
MNEELPSRLSDLIAACRDLSAPYLLDGRPLTAFEVQAIYTELQKWGFYTGVIKVDDIFAGLCPFLKR